MSQTPNFRGGCYRRTKKGPPLSNRQDFISHYPFQALYLKCLICEVADSEREFVEGNMMGYIQNKKKPDVYPKDEEANGMTTKTFNIKPPS